MLLKKNPGLVLATVLILAAFSPARAALVIINNNNAIVADPTQRLVSAAPYDNEVLDKAPASVTLTFSQPVRPDKSAIKIYDSFGVQITVSPLVLEGTALSVTLPPLAPGRYSVKWRARCQCDEDTELSDNFRFTVRPEN